MNKQRRNRIAEALELISQARGILEEVKDEEQESYENLPESLQYGKCSLQKKCGVAGMDGGACLGFSCDGDDEPIERCKRCIACTSFDWEEEKERLKL